MSSSDSSVRAVEATRAYERRVDEAADVLREGATSIPSLGLVLRPGIAVPDSFSATASWGDALPQWPGNAEKNVLATGTLAGTSVVLVPDAAALHEGHTPREVVFPIRVLAAAGVETLLFATTAAGVAPEIAPGGLVLAADHINFQGANPLVGPNVDAWGPRFPDMTHPYAASLRRSARAVARREGLRVQEGVYFATMGPDRGSPAEFRMARTLGADVLGTDTVQSVIAARHMDVEVLSVSVVTEGRRPTGGSANSSSGRGEPLRDAQSRLHVHALLAGIVSSVKSKEKSEE
ncbi:MAG: purine-nucleoside phosphorylase [Bacteroidetes bacterium SW_9_63_38]|nr:MAG: purine-nucleoside phosphorylase [Bacteroidetes bacterium SW_9_63_38]